MIRINNTQYFHFLQQADALRRAGLLCDAIISVQSQTFRAHRLVLACASRRLAQQLTQGDADSPVHCSLELLSPRTFQQVLDFTYTQALEVPVDDLHLLLRAAQLLEMQSLEDQCQKQVDTLDCRSTEDEERGEIAEPTETADETDPRAKGSLMTEETLRGNSSPAEEASYTHTMENPLPSDPAEDKASPTSPRKKQRMSPMSATPYKRDSVIARSAASHSSYSSPWAFPKNMWHPMNALKRMAQNLIAARPLQPSPQAVTYPFPFPNPHMLPLLASSFPSQVHSSVMGYPGVHHPYTQNLYSGSPGMGDIVKQSLLSRKKAGHKAFIGTVPSSEPRYTEEHRARTERVKDCQHCSASLLSNSLLQESTTSTSSAEACAGHRFCGRGDEMRPLQPHRQDLGIEKPYQCQHCPKRFSLKHQLDTHHRVHTGEKPFECRLCGQRSRDYSAMIKHLRTHGGAAPYQCTVCLEFCSSLVAMQRHVKSHAVQDFPPDWSINNTYLYTSHI